MERGKKSRVQLNPQRAVEIDLTGPSHRKVTVFEGKNPVSTITDPSGGGAMSIIGGDRATNSSWFIVVRRDKPAN